MAGCDLWLACRGGVEQGVVSGEADLRSQQASSNHAFPLSLLARDGRGPGTPASDQSSLCERTWQQRLQRALESVKV